MKIYLLLRLYSWIPEEISIEYSYKKQFVFSNNSSSFFFLPYSTLKQTKTRFSLSFLLSFLRSRNDRTKFWNYEKSTIKNPSSVTTSKMLISPQSLSHVPRYRSPISKRYQRRGPRVQSFDFTGRKNYAHIVAAPSKKISNVHPLPFVCPRRSSSEARINPRRRWSVPWFTAAENLWSRSFRRVPPVWEFVRGRSKRRKRVGRKKEGRKEREKERKEKRRKWSKKGEAEREREGYRGWKDSTWPTFINIAIVRAPRAVFFIPYLLSRVPASVYARSYILEARFATGWLLSGEGGGREGERMRPVGPFDLWNDPTTRGNISFRCTRSVSRETNRQRHRETVTRPPLYGLHTWATNLLPLSIFRRDFCPIVGRNLDKIERKSEIIILLSNEILLKKKFVLQFHEIIIDKLY